MKDNRREAKAPQKRSLSALRCLFEEHGKRPQSVIASKCSKLGLSGAYTLLVSLCASQAIPGSRYL